MSGQTVLEKHVNYNALDRFVFETNLIFLRFDIHEANKKNLGWFACYNFNSH